MRNVLSPELEQGRVLNDPHYGSKPGKLWGAFFILGPRGAVLRLLSSGPDKTYGWEHVSVSLDDRCPEWDEMCFVKELFWEDEECVMQLHPPKSDYVNRHPYVLHLWRPLDGKIPRPKRIQV